MKNKFNIINILFPLIFFINIPPEYLSLNHYFLRGIEFLQIITFIILLFVYCAYAKRNGVSLFIILILLFYLVFNISTIIHHGKIIGSLRPLINTFNICCLCVLFNKKSYNYIKSFLIYLEIITIINLITILLFPNGLYMVYGNVNPHFFLGHRNNSVEYILPMLCTSAIYDNLRDRNFSFNSAIVLIVSIMTVIFTWSANAIVVVFFFIFSVYSPLKKYIKKSITCLKAFIVYIISFFLIIVYRLQYYFEWFIVGVLHKSLDFTYRTYIWDKAFFWIKRSPLLGYGYENEMVKTLKISHPNSCHNYMLDFMYMGGIVMVLIVLMMIILINKKLKESNTQIAKIIIITICSYFILWFATPIHKDTLCLMFLIFTLGYYVGDLLFNRKGEL